MKNKIVRVLLAGIVSMSLVASNCSYVLAANVTKEETVYVKTDKTGKETSVTVTDQLENISGKKEIQDISDLKDIENVKGDEEFKQNGNKITWKNSESDKIVYQGTTNKELPVGVNISYELEGKKITPEKLSGKSGHLKINVEYINRTNGNDYVPFVMGTVFMADEEEMTNVSVDNGRVISDGERQVIVGYGVPGIKAYIETDSLKNNDMLKDIDTKIPEGFSVEADITDYDDITCMSIALNDVFSDGKIDTKDSLDKLQDSMKELTDAATKLADGSNELANGTQKLKDASGELTSGVDKLDKGSVDLSKGTGSLVKGSKTLKDGAKTLADGAGELAKGSKALYDGTDGLATGAQSIAEGITASKTGADQLVLGTTQLQEGAGGISKLAGAIEQAKGAIPTEIKVSDTELGAKLDVILTEKGITDESTKTAILEAINGETISAGAQTIAGKTALDTYSAQLTGAATAVEAGAKNLNEGATALSSGLSTLETGASTLSKSAGELKSGAKELNKVVKSADSGAKELAKGSKTLWSGASDLDSGAAKLSEGLHTLNGGSTQLVAGVNDLNKGAIELRDGVKKFNDEGISKLNNIIGKDVERLVNRVNKMTDNAANYKNCTGISEGMDGTVKFIFVTK